ncbi:MAG: hypothetical protein HYX66_08840 [Ignavibacteria bacterium]|nr:hypothetical protein [Ignavibacteria bacterium]
MTVLEKGKFIVGASVLREHTARLHGMLTLVKNLEQRSPDDNTLRVVCAEFRSLVRNFENILNVAGAETYRIRSRLKKEAAQQQKTSEATTTGAQAQSLLSAELLRWLIGKGGIKAGSQKWDATLPVMMMPSKVFIATVMALVDQISLISHQGNAPDDPHDIIDRTEFLSQLFETHFYKLTANQYMQDYEQPPIFELNKE